MRPLSCKTNAIFRSVLARKWFSLVLCYTEQAYGSHIKYLGLSFENLVFLLTDLRICCFHFPVFGCKLPELPSDMRARQNGDELKVRCNKTSDSWTLTCSNGQWVGSIGNCSKWSISIPLIDGHLIDTLIGMFDEAINVLVSHMPR